MKKTSLLLTTLAALVALTVLPASPAAAAVKTAFAKGTLTITGTSGDDTIDVDCGGGKVVVNSPTTVDCIKVKHLVANLGDGIDDLNMGLMFSGDFTALLDTTVHAGPGNDDVTGSFVRDMVFGEGGADRHNYAVGNDLFNGGPGWDIFASAACDCNITLNAGTLAFSNGNQIKLVGANQMYLTGGASANTIDIGQWTGRSTIFAQGGNDTITGGSGMDDINPSAGVDTVTAAGGDDVITVDETPNSNDTLAGGTGNDTLYGGTLSANSTLSNTQLTGFGTDTLFSFEDAHLDRSSTGTTDASAFSGPVQLGGSSGNDTLFGGSGDDLIITGQGVDTVDGNGGTDRIESSTGTGSTLTNALLSSSTGNKTISDIESARIFGHSGTAGIFNTAAFSGPVTLSDTGGNDNITGNGQTHLYAGSLSPGITYTAPNLSGSGRTITLSGVSSVEFGLTSGGSVDLGGFPGRVVVYGSDDADQITAGGGKDWLAGYGGNDTILAGGGKDKLYGGNGRDTLNGQAGRDGCNGSPGITTLISCEVAIKPLPEK